MKTKRIKQFVFFLTMNFLFVIVLTLFLHQHLLTPSALLILFEPLETGGNLLAGDIPLIFYLFMIALIYSISMHLYLAIKKRQQAKKIVKALTLLNEGYYSADLFLKMFSKDTPAQISPVIDQGFLKLQEKMLLLSEEAVSTTELISKMTKESKEEIVTNERKRIARELHDSVSQQLFAAAMLLSALQVESDQISPELDEKIKLIHSIIEEAQSEMRALLLHLRPVKLEGKSLKNGIQDLLEELEAKVPVIIYYEIDDIQLTEVMENHLFRMIQELLSNVLRHAEANKLEVYFKQMDDFYRLRFIDDGKGFDMEQHKNSALGLLTIQERIERLGGQFQLISFPNQGTSVEIKIPLVTGRFR